MSTPEDLSDLYTDELKDLWSANDQMQRVLKKVGSKALGLDDDAKQLSETVKDIYGADKYSSKLAEPINQDAEAEG